MGEISAFITLEEILKGRELKRGQPYILIQVPPSEQVSIRGSDSATLFCN